MPELDHQRERIQEDLRGLISGDVRCDNLFCQLFASDGSIYEIRPLGVVRPRSTADVAACVRYAADKRISLHARGGGSGMAGESLGAGLVLDFSKYLRRVVACRCGRGARAAGHCSGAAQFAIAAARAALRSRSGQRSRDHHRQHDRRRRLRVALVEVRFRAAARPQPASGDGRRPGDGVRPRADRQWREHRQQSAEAGADQPPLRRSWPPRPT